MYVLTLPKRSTARLKAFYHLKKGNFLLNMHVKHLTAGKILPEKTHWVQTSQGLCDIQQLPGLVLPQDFMEAQMAMRA